VYQTLRVKTLFIYFYINYFSFQDDYSRAVLLPFLVPCCFLGSRVLLREGAQVLEGDPAWWSWIRDALSLEKSWLDSTVVDPGSNHCYFNCGRSSRQINNRRALPMGFYWLDILFIFYLDSIFLIE
jgi:hypothetical protein